MSLVARQPPKPESPPKSESKAPEDNVPFTVNLFWFCDRGVWERGWRHVHEIFACPLLVTLDQELIVDLM